MNFFERLNWPTVVAFGWFCGCVAYVLTHVPAETWEHIAHVNVYALCAGIAALLGALNSFFRGPVIKPKSEPPLALSQMPPASAGSIPPSPKVPSEFVEPRASVAPKEEA